MKKIPWLLAVLFLIFPKDSFAYLDPGSGSYLLQILLAGLLAASLTLKTFWRNLMGPVTRLFSKRSKENERDSRP